MFTKNLGKFAKKLEWHELGAQKATLEKKNTVYILPPP
jgi:hypothetical protein